MRSGAGRDDDMVGRYSPAPSAPVGLPGRGLLDRTTGSATLRRQARRPSLAPDRLDLVLLQQAADPWLRRPETAATLHDRVSVDPDVVGGEAIILRVAHEFENFRGAQ